MKIHNRGTRHGKRIGKPTRQALRIVRQFQDVTMLTKARCGPVIKPPAKSMT
jgi:hypothetical protein